MCLLVVLAEKWMAIPGLPGGITRAIYLPQKHTLWRGSPDRLGLAPHFGVWLIFWGVHNGALVSGRVDATPAVCNFEPHPIDLLAYLPLMLHSPAFNSRGGFSHSKGPAPALELVVKSGSGSPAGQTILRPKAEEPWLRDWSSSWIWRRAPRFTMKQKGS